MSTSRQVFSPAQRQLLDSPCLNRIIPPQDNRPGAGSLGIGDFVESRGRGRTGPHPPVRPGPCRHRDRRRRAWRRTVSPPCPMGPRTRPCGPSRQAHADFFDQLVLQVYNGYYSNLTVFEKIGYTICLLPPNRGVKLELLDDSFVRGAAPAAPLLDPGIADLERAGYRHLCRGGRP